VGKIKHIALFFFVFTASTLLNAQYFGKNKVQYKRFNFIVQESPHFQLHHYLKDSIAIRNFSLLAEQWYSRHLSIFNDTLEEPNPIILHNNHADFQQTTVIDGMLSTSTSGVTEGFRTRVVMPYLESNRETSHVLGHEMVHIFQYRMFKNNDSLSLQSIMYVPLWMIEGMAEYLSIGNKDSHTAIWMRDAYQQKDIPTIEDITKDMNEYFPYRYGHAAWAYITSEYGDKVLTTLMRNSAIFGYDKAIKHTLGISDDSLSKKWELAFDRKYKSLYESMPREISGSLLFSSKNSGDLNIAPVISANDQNLVFLSDRDVISLDFFLANPNEKLVLKKLSKSVEKAYIDEYKYLGSSGSWAPDNRHYALTSFVKGQNRLLIMDTKKKKLAKKIEIKAFDSYSNPEWNPKSNDIVLTGLLNGKTDLFIYNIDSQQTITLTNDGYSDIMPSWSPDGKSILFSSDRGEDTNLDSLKYGNYQLSLITIADQNVKTLNILKGANNLDPHFTPDGNGIIFLSDADGFRNLFLYKLNEDSLYRLTNYFTGITGITELSPAISISDSGNIYYTLLIDDEYKIYKAHISDFKKTYYPKDSINQDMAILPLADTSAKLHFVTDRIEENLYSDSVNLKQLAYRRRFKLEFIGSSGGAGVGGVGAGIGQFDAAMYGSVQMFFGDVLKRNQIFTAFQVNGEFQDIGGSIYYLNKEHRVNWGVGIGHFPYRYSLYTYDAILRFYTFIDQIGLFCYLPLTKKTRLETGGNLTLYSYRIDSLYSDGAFGLQRKKLPVPQPYLYFENYIAFVGDDATYGFNSPMDGYRYRIELEKYYGDVNVFGALIDLRKYFFVRPGAFAFRLMHYGKYGGTKKWPYNYFINNDFFFIRGYSRFDQSIINPEFLTGTKLGMINAEYRLPFSGHKRLSLLNSKYVYTDLVAFFDGGLAWDTDFIWSKRSKISWQWQPSLERRTPLFSTGLSLRFNLFGMMILEPYYAFPLQEASSSNGRWGFTISMGGW